MITKAKVKPSRTRVKLKVATSFPTQEIEACIREFLAEEGEIQAELRGKKSSSESLTGSFGPQPAIDSLVCVEVLLELESKVPFTLSESMIRAGGYASVDEVVNNLLPQLKSRWKKHYGVTS
jgi:acyl carrier protein